MEFNDTAVAREIADLNRVMHEPDVKASVGKLFSKVPQSVLNTFFSSEPLAHERFFDKGGREISGGEEVKYTVLNDYKVRAITIMGRSYLDIVIYKLPIYDKNYSYTPQKLRNNYGVEIEDGYNPRVVLTLTSQPTNMQNVEDIKKIKQTTIEKVLLTSRMHEYGKILTINKCNVYVPEQTITSVNNVSISSEIAKEKE
mgnify:FL=1